MAPRPMRETSSSLSLMCFTVATFPSRRRAVVLGSGWDDPEGRGARLRADDGVDDAGGGRAGPGGVGAPEGRGARLRADDGVDDAGGVAAVPGAVGRVDLVVQVVAVADDPDGPGVAEGAVASTRGDLQFFGGRDPGAFVVGPCGHGDSLGRRLLWRRRGGGGV